MFKYYSASEYDRGFLLELSISGDIIKAKALLVTPDEDVCLDIFSIPFDEDYRIIAIPDWNLSFFYDSSNDSTDYSFLKGNCFTDIFTITVDIIHSLTVSFPSAKSAVNYAEGNNISVIDNLLSYPLSNSLNQHLPF